MFPSFHPLLLHCAGNFAKHKSILWKLQLKSHHLPPLTGLYSTLNGIKYFIVTCTVIDTELWLCLDKNFMKCFIPDWFFNILQIHSVFSEVIHSVLLCTTKMKINWLFLTRPIFMSVLSSHHACAGGHKGKKAVPAKSVPVTQIALNTSLRAFFFWKARKVFWRLIHLFICLYGLVCVL